MLCIITKPKQGFEVAFKMFDTDGNQLIDREEFKILEGIFSQGEDSAAANKIRESQIDTTLSYFFFGPEGKLELTHSNFYNFMHNLQSEGLSRCKQA